ncbi:polysaccharide deacetylase domain protein [Treponema primitia ZAS-2]|uniref:Polysaccharide deacetylase domain protein n=1 Tax=Treponema primitia (strain ATCC BAA-887 / DSM 12427 / ZAS-2) TaxID=545694 RepID=F5YMH9_TREPZ|nr:polysaccharide deacetylase family protein [Treponema primitia]AEF85686.1 polysaccharide deacetylase domain protein [Treponema primitia ZAS-2]
MEKRVFLFVSVLTALSALSCASRPSSVPSGAPESPGSQDVAPEYPAELPGEAEPPPLSMEELIRKIKANDPDLPREYSIDEAGRIVVTGDLPGYGISWDPANARLRETGASGKPEFEMDFSVTEKDSGDERTGSFLWEIKEDDSGILLGFDDDYQAVWERYFDLLDRYEARVTFFIQGDYSSFCTAALSRGHEIGYHTKNHLNLVKVSRQVFFEETLGAVETFRLLGFPLRAFAFPYGLSEPWMYEALETAFSVLRGFGVTYRLYTAEAIRAGYISSKSIDNTQYKNDEAFRADIRAMLRVVKFSGGVLPLTTHTIAANAAWGISPERLEYLLKTAAELKLKFYRYGDFFSGESGNDN